MQKKIFHTSLLLTLIVLALLFSAFTAWLYRAESTALEQSLGEESRLLASVLAGQADESAALAGVASSRRRTLIAPDGTVLYDTSANAAGMDNHAGREEVALARENGFATVTRRSGTLSREMVYHAMLLPSGSVLRLAAPRSSVWGHVADSLPWMLLALVACVALAAGVSRVSTRRLVKPIAAIDLEHPLENECYEELAPLLKRLGEQQQDSLRQMDSLREQKRSMSELLSHMREGLVIMNRNERILSINDAARDALGLKGRSCVGHTLLELNRSPELLETVNGAHGGQSVSGAWQNGAKHYHISASRIGADEGTLLLMLDDTAEYGAETMRRQFTANVSHELRTPLTAISGYAELMESGMVQPGDEQTFVKRIRHEASRMLRLVEDILRLSQLDEGSVRLESRLVDLFQAARDVVDSLSDKAASRGVHIEVFGGSVTLRTDPTLLSEILYNLTDNAVKYNRAGGTVTVDVSERDGKPEFRVRDTGIGIPPEQRQKVFERFYRVDKSRSKETGGTGLGLSIVKHAAQLLGAEVVLESEVDKGTSVTVRFAG